MEEIISGKEFRNLLTTDDQSKTKIYYRGQMKNWCLIPSAARNFLGKELYKRDFGKFINKFKKIHPKITFQRANNTFGNIICEMYPQFTELFQSNISKDIAQFWVQALLQQYSRSTLLLDITDNIDVALFMGIHRFYESGIYKGRFIQRAELQCNGFCYLSVFNVPESNILTFEESAIQKVVEKGLKLKYRAENSGVDMSNYIVYDCKNMKKAKRCYNQNSCFLTYLPSNEYNHKIDNKYCFDGLFDRKVYKISKDIVLNYFKEKRASTYNRISLFPKNDFVLNYIRERVTERNYAINNRELGNTDLGISVHRYFPDIDQLSIPCDDNKYL